eukprot:m51a1_g13739 hypothetical protein (1077) ;mRNA; f:165001-168514
MDSSVGVSHVCFSHDSKHVFAAGGRAIVRWEVRGLDSGAAPAASDGDSGTPRTEMPLARRAVEDAPDSTDEPTPLDAWRKKKQEQDEAVHKRSKDMYVEKLARVKKHLAEIVQHNEDPELTPEERLTADELLVNTEEQERLRGEGERRRAILHEQIKYENLERDYLVQKLKSEFWDSQQDHAIVIRGFKKKIEVGNFPLATQRPEETQLLRKIMLLRKTELLEFKARMRALSTQLGVPFQWPPKFGYFSGSIRLLQLRALEDQERKNSLATRVTKVIAGQKGAKGGKPEPATAASPAAPASAPEPAQAPADAAAAAAAASSAPKEKEKEKEKEKDKKEGKEGDDAEGEGEGEGENGESPSSRAAAETNGGAPATQGAPTGAAGTGDDDDTLHLNDEATEAELRALLYHPFDLHTPHRKRTQIQLHQFIIREVKRTFNDEALKYLEMKNQAIAKISERNARIRDITEELKEHTEIWQPELDDAERPESVLSVRDDEISSTIPQRVNRALHSAVGGAAQAAGAAPDEEQQCALRGLKVMMGGKLSGRTNHGMAEDQEEEQRPEWMSSKQVFTEEEKKAIREFEKRQQTLREERQKHRKALETELKKLQGAIGEVCTTFDDKLSLLFTQKMTADQQISEEELKVVRLSTALLIQEENDKQEATLSDTVEQLKKKRAKCSAKLGELKAQFDEAKLDYESKMQNDRVIERSFRRDFEKSEREEIYPVLLKVFRYRRKERSVAKASGAGPAAPAAGRDSEGDPFYGLEADTAGPLGMRQAMQQQVAIDEQSLTMRVDKPPEIDDVTWERLLEVRTEKIKSEISVKRASARFEEAKSNYRLGQQKSERVKARLEECVARMQEFKKQQLWDSLNLELLFKLKQGQIEVEQAPVVTRYDDSAIIETSIVEELNGQIREFAREKASLLEEIMNTKKLIQKKRWENQGLDMQAQDLQDKTKFLQLLRQAQELSALERRAQHEKRGFELKVADITRKIEKIEAETREKEGENDKVLKSIAELSISVSERKKIHEIQQQATEEEEVTESKLERLHKYERLVATVRGQTQDIAKLRGVLDKLRQSTFPML